MSELSETMEFHQCRLTLHDRSLRPRSRRLYATNVACAQKHGQGLLETGIEEGIIDEKDFEIEVPDDYKPQGE